MYEVIRCKVELFLFNILKILGLTFGVEYIKTIENINIFYDHKSKKDYINNKSIYVSENNFSLHRMFNIYIYIYCIKNDEIWTSTVSNRCIYRYLLDYPVDIITSHIIPILMNISVEAFIYTIYNNKLSYEEFISCMFENKLFEISQLMRIKKAIVDYANSDLFLENLFKERRYEALLESESNVYESVIKRVKERSVFYTRVYDPITNEYIGVIDNSK